jgi:carboxypeptidase Q
MARPWRCGLLAVRLLLAPIPVAAQQAADSGALARIRDEGLHRSQVLATALQLSDGNGARLAGSPAYDSAAAWAVRRLGEWDVPGARLEPWGRRGPSWVLKEYSVEMVAPSYLRLHAFPFARSQRTRGPVKGPVVLVDLAHDSSFARYRGRLRGRVALMGRLSAGGDRFQPGARRLTEGELDSLERATDPGQPRTYWDDQLPWDSTIDRMTRVRGFLRREGVLAVLEGSGGPTVQAPGYHTYVESSADNLPAFSLAQDHFDRVAALIARGDRVEVEASLDARFLRADSVGYNVIAEIPGTDPDLGREVVMLGGHLDSWHPGTGAADNAAGSAVAMEAMRLLVAAGVRPRRTIRMALWDGEEQEKYFGSQGYVSRHFGDPVTMRLLPEHAGLSAYFNVDHGTGRIRGVYLQGNAAARPAVAELLLDTGARLLDDDLRQAAVVLASVVYGAAMRNEKVPRPGLPPAGRPGATPAGGVPGSP